MAYEQKELLYIRRPCVKYLREVISLNQLKRFEFLYWTCPPDMGKQTAVRAGILKLNGYEKGNFDMLIIGSNKWANKVFLIEFKTEKGKYTPEQQAIADKAKGTAATVLIIRNIDEFKEFVERELK